MVRFTDSWLSNKSVSHHRSAAGWGTMLNLLKDNRMKAVALHLSSRGILRQGITALLPLFSAKLLGFNTTTIGLVTSVFAFTEAISQGVVGPIADRANKKLLLIGGSLVAAIIVFFGRNMTDAFGQLLILVPVAITTSIARASASAHSVEIGAKHNSVGACMGLANAAQDFGHFLGPILFGLAIDNFGESSIFAVGGISGFVAIPFMVLSFYAKQPEEAYAIPEPVPIRESAGGGNGSDGGTDN